MLHLGSIGGTSIDVDFSFFLLCAFWTISSYDARYGVQYALLWIPVLFLSVLLHELAHAGSFAIFGFGSSRIVLGGMGGVTMSERGVRARPWQDMLISAAGPLSNFAIAFVCRRFADAPAVAHDPMLAAFVPYMYFANKWWGIFNLLPVPPLDGGHALRGLLQTFLRERLAFTIAVWVAIIAGAAMAIFWALDRNFLLAALIGWFAFNNFQAWEEYRRRGHPGD
jgi:stage IV sporulation protein FB